MVPSKLHVALCIFLSVLCVVHGQGKNPCHPNKNSYGNGVTCEGVQLPPGLCNSCSLKGVKPNGDFVNCKSIYNIDNGQCKAQMQQYVSLNPCDSKRKQQLARMNQDDKFGLDYFLYSICEQCCDCIKKGTKIGMYENLKSKHSLWNPSLYITNRGNCPAHAFYDVCKVLPNIRYVTYKGGPKGTDWPKICPLLTGWFNSPAANNWLANQNVQISFPIKRFLNLMNAGNSCAMKSIWSKCLVMEQKQKRVRRR